ncbi:MAG: hypothetical protein LKJ69_06140 [Lactobacillus sp.]|jgi:hypothetical protein|nr:hypothetical protein [Lactobacillus sp.]MCI2032967.1 hypothetical protein [Lactobacillus sp.]
MHEIPETVDQAAALATKLNWPLERVIQRGLQNWAQQLLDEGFEGGYLTASLQADGLHIADINGQPLLVEPSLTTALATQFQESPHATLLAVQTKLRALIDSGKIH